jgi:hypothetical protein
MTAEIYLVPDTNVFLHFPPITDVDWLKVCGVKSASILIAPVVLRELNKHKDAPRTQRVRDRAAAALRELHARFVDAKTKNIRTSVEIAFVSRDPSLDFLSYGLIRELNDDWLIATALQVKIDNAHWRVAIVSADFGLQVKAAGQVEVIQMPDTLRIPDELNSEQKQILELQRRLHKVEAASPELKLTFANKKSYAALEFFELHPWTPEQKLEEIKRARSKYPKVVPRARQGDVTFDFSFITDTQIAQYNDRLENYFKELALYYSKLETLAAWYATTAKVELLLSNTGGAPSEDIDISVHFPDGMDVLEQENIPRVPDPPEAPGKFGDSFMQMLRVPNFDIPALSPANFPAPRFVENAQLLGIKKTNSYDAEFHVQRLKHQNEEELPLVYLHFSVQPRPFRAEYRIVAGDIPEPITGTLDFLYSQDDE